MRGVRREALISAPQRGARRWSTPRHALASPGDTLRSYAKGRGSVIDGEDGEGQLLIPVVLQSCGPLGMGLRPSSSKAEPTAPATVPAHGGGESQALYARRMRAMERTDRELLAAAQAKLEVGRVCTVIKVGDLVLRGPRSCSTRQTSASCGRGGTAHSRSDGLPRPNRNRLHAVTLGALPRRMRCSPSVNANRLRVKPFYAAVDAPPAPGPVSDPGGARLGGHARGGC